MSHSTQPQARKVTMSQARCNARRRRQAANGFAHMSPRKRPNYRKRHLSVADSIARERQQAAAEARRAATKKKA